MEKKFAFILYVNLALLLYITCIVSVAAYYAVENSHLVTDINDLISDVDVALDEVSSIQATVDEFTKEITFEKIETLLETTILATEQRIYTELDIDNVRLQITQIQADVQQIRDDLAVISGVFG